MTSEVDNPSHSDNYGYKETADQKIYTVGSEDRKTMPGHGCPQHWDKSVTITVDKASGNLFMEDTHSYTNPDALHPGVL